MKKWLILLVAGLILIGSTLVGRKILELREIEEEYTFLEQEITLMEGKEKKIDEKLNTLKRKQQNRRENVFSYQDDHQLYGSINSWAIRHNLAITSFKITQQESKTEIFHTSVILNGEQNNWMTFLKALEDMNQTVYPTKLILESKEDQIQGELNILWVTQGP